LHSLLSGEGGWQVRDADVEEEGCQDGYLWGVVTSAVAGVTVKL